MSLDEFPPAQLVDILIVEDSLTQAMKLQHVLEQHGHRVTVTRNGEEALATLRAMPPQMVITDINMPKMDGYELCRRIKDDPQTTALPVILLTSLSDPKDILNGLECGADNFIVKPYDEDFLLSRIQYVIANSELRRNGGEERTEVFFAGHKYRFSSARIHSLDLLLSTYETAVLKNLELSKAKELLERRATELREKNEQMEADLIMARELQRAFLPQESVFPHNAAPEKSALQFCHRYRTTTELGGDFFDILTISNEQVGVFICDVMGHGVRAALVTALIRGLIEELMPFAGDPGEFLSQMNESLCAILKQTTTPLFASAFYAVIDVADGVIRYANAGHPSPFHLQRTANKLSRLEPQDGRHGPALGVFEKTIYPEADRRLAARDGLILFTDGFYEVEGKNGVFYDQQQLSQQIERHMQLDTGLLFDKVVEKIRAFSATQNFEDDLCLVGVEVARTGG